MSFFQYSLIIISILSLVHSDVKINLDLIEKKYIYINIGEPAQKLKFFIDMSSPINFIFEKNCEGCLAGKQNYNPNQSKSLKKSHIFYSLDTVFGNFQGHFSNEQFMLNNMVNFNLDFLLVNSTTSKIVECDGILGLGISNEEKYAEFSSMSLLTRLKNENFLTNKLVLFDNKNKQLKIGNVFSGNNEYLKLENSNNVSIFKLNPSDNEYPTSFANFKGFAHWNGEITETNEKIVKYIDLKVSFQNSNENKMNNLILPSNKKEILSDYLLSIIFSKFNCNYDIKEEKSQDQSTPDVMVRSTSDTNHMLVYYDKSSIKPNDFQTGMIIDDNVIYFNVSSSKEFEINNEKNNLVLNVDVTNDISDFVFLGLDYLNSSLLIFDYDNNEVKMYNCISCGIKSEVKSYLWLFLSVLFTSLGLIIFLFLGIIYYVKVKKIPHVKILKNYNLII